MSRSRRRALGLLLVVVLAGCAEAGAARDGRPVAADPSSEAAPPSPLFPATLGPACPEQAVGRLSDDDVGVTDAYICHDEIRTVPGDGVWLFRVARRVTGGVDALLEAYRVPDEHSTDPELLCPSVGWDPLVVYVHSDSGPRAVRAPGTVCGAPMEAARSAYESVVTEVVDERREHQIQSQLSVDSGCSDEYKDTLA